MYPIISKWTILDHFRDEVIAALKALVIKVQQAEPDTWAYTVHTPDFNQPSLPTPAAGEVIFFEIYKDEAAFLSHVSGPVFTDFVATFGDMFLSSHGRPYTTLEIMIQEAGFFRPNCLP